jgi:hypothetical protein
MMKFAPMVLLLLVACGDGTTPQAQAPATTVQAASYSQFGHLAPIQLPAGEYFAGFNITPAGNTGVGYGGASVPERYFFSTTTAPHTHEPCNPHGTHTLRDAQGIPVLIVKD